MLDSCNSSCHDNCTAVKDKIVCACYLFNNLVNRRMMKKVVEFFFFFLNSFVEELSGVHGG